MAITAAKYMEELYTLQVSFGVLAADVAAGFTGVEIDAAYEDNWIKKLKFTPGAAEDRPFLSAAPADFSGRNVFDVLAIISTIAEDPGQEPVPFGAFIAFYRIRYIPANPAGARVRIEFYVSNQTGFDQQGLATIGLSHSINR